MDATIAPPMRVLLRPLEVGEHNAIRSDESRRKLMEGLIRALEKGDSETKRIAQTAVRLALWEELVAAFEADSGPLPLFVRNIQLSVRSFEEKLG